MIRRIAAGFAWSLLASSLLLGRTLERGDAKKAKAYLQEVKKHLLESFVDRDKLSDEQLTRAGVKALAGAAKGEDLRDALRDAKSLGGAIDAAAELVGDDFDFLAFADHAARAMVRETGDPYSRILTQEEFQKLLKMMQGGSREDSPGLAVQAGTGKVMYVQYGYPAYDEGIEIGDVVLEINGGSLQGKGQEELNESLRLRPGQALELKVERPGHPSSYLFRIEPRKTKVQDVRTEYLGDGIGYLRMTIFDLKLSSEVKKGLKKLRDEGMKGLILDLRHNPGGALPASTAVADLFLPQGLVIATTESNYKPSFGGFRLPGVGGDQEFKTKSASDFETIPLVVLINGASASASELLCGALQDHRRGKLIGETTYGKGVGQSPIFLESTFQERFLYLTVLTYKLPSGRSIHHKGVVPDIRFASEKPSPEEFAERWRIRAGGGLEKYASGLWDDHARVLRKLAENDGFETARYPDFDALFASLKTSLTRDQVREELRRAIRKHVERADGAVWVADLESDLQLQRALVEMLDLLQ